MKKEQANPSPEKASLAQKIEFSDADFPIFVQERKPSMQEKAFHEEFEIKLFLEGNAALMIDKTVYFPQKGEITVVNPYEIHANLNVEHSNGRYLLLMVGMDFLDALRSTGIDFRSIFLERGRKLQNRIPEDGRISRILLRISEEVQEQGEYYRTAVYHLVGELFALLLRDYGQREELAEERVQVRERHLIAPALAYIHAHYREQLTVEMLAELCNLSKYYFSRLFKRLTQVSVIQYLNRYRVDVAEVLLREGKKNIAEIAWVCGFDDESYFYRCYRKHKGCSPGKTRAEGLQQS
jgi:AraC-like DNA-binding protein